MKGFYIRFRSPENDEVVYLAYYNQVLFREYARSAV